MLNLVQKVKKNMLPWRYTAFRSSKSKSPKSLHSIHRCFSQPNSQTYFIELSFTDKKITSYGGFSILAKLFETAAQILVFLLLPSDSVGV